MPLRRWLKLNEVIRVEPWYNWCPKKETPEFFFSPWVDIVRRQPKLIYHPTQSKSQSPLNSQKCYTFWSVMSATCDLSDLIAFDFLHSLSSFSHTGLREIPWTFSASSHLWALVFPLLGTLSPQILASLISTLKCHLLNGVTPWKILPPPSYIPHSLFLSAQY